MKVLYSSFIHFFILSSYAMKDNNSTSIIPINEENSQSIIIQQNELFSIFPLDSIMSKICGQTLFEVQINQMDTIKNHHGVISLLLKDISNSIIYFFLLLRIRI